MTQAISFSALAAVALALLVGILLARTLTRPIRDLIDGTRAVAQGDLGHQVAVQTDDELGELGASFNQMSADLAQASAQRRQMTADIAHELRTPLSVILGYTEALQDGKLQGTPETFAVMHKEAQHLNHLVDDLRTLALADAGELPLTPQQVSALDLLERTAAAHQALVKDRGIDLRVQVTEDLPALHVDPERIAQVLGNLVSNALRFTPEGGEILLGARPQQGAVQLLVQDSGEGIAPEDLPHIFKRFYQGDKARAGDGESGLGLAIAKSLVEMLGGEIAAESTPGEGATFIITLPVYNPNLTPAGNSG
jgi:signal transduction histidine kinase